MITFVRETESLDFAGAVEWLAERFRVTLEYEETSPQLEESRKRRDRLHAVLDQAASFYERHLWESAAGAPVRAYLESRGLGEPVCREFRLGLSPGSGLAAKAQEKGFTRDELQGAGLTNARGNDYFPPRLMFPLADARGRIVGFQARKLRDDDPLKGKYVNSPEGELFHKSAILYGLHLARTAIAKQERGVVVEGNTDVIALRQAGFEPVIASMGTALTERQLKELQRLTRRIYLCFDSDAAGEEATLRGMELAKEKLGFDVRVVTLPKGQDPADAPAGFEARLGGAESYIVYRVRLVLDRTPDRQEAFVRGREILQRNEDSPDWQDALRLLRRPARPSQGDAGRPDAEGRRADAHRGAVAEAAREGRPARAERARRLSGASLAREAARRAHSRALRLRAQPPLPGAPRRGRRARERPARAPGRAGRPRRAGGAGRADGQGAAPEPARARLRRELAHAEFDQMKELQTQLARVKDAILELA